MPKFTEQIHNILTSEYQEDIKPIQPSIILTTILLNDWDFSIHDYRQAQLGDIQYRLKQLQGEDYTPIICFRHVYGEEIPNSFKKEVHQCFKNSLSKNTILYFMDEENEHLLKNFGDYSFREMIKRKIIQYVPTFVNPSLKDISLEVETIVKMYLKAPYPSELKAYSDKRIYLPAKCGGGIVSLFSSVWCFLNSSQSFNLYETCGNELILCDSDYIRNLSFQNHTHQRGVFNYLVDVNVESLRGARLTCDIIPHDLIAIPERNSNHWFHSCEVLDNDYKWKENLDRYCLDQSEFDNLLYNSKKYSSVDEVHYYIQNKLLGRNNERELCHANNSHDTPVKIRLDSQISSNMLKTKLYEKRLLNVQHLSEIIKSIIFEREMGYEYGYDTFNDTTVALENRWCLLHKNDWFQEAREKTKNQKIRKCMDQMIHTIICRDYEFKPYELCYNYMLSSAFVLCLSFFKDHNVLVDQLTERMWDYLLNPFDESMNDTIFHNLKNQLITCKDIHIIQYPENGARLAFFSSFHGIVPNQFVYHKFPELYVGRMSTRLPRTGMRFYNVEYPDYFHLFNCSKGNEHCSTYCEYVIRSILRKVLYIHSNRNKLHTQNHDGVLDKYLRYRAHQFMESSKNNYENGNYLKIVQDLKTLHGLLNMIVKFKKRLHQEHSSIFLEVVEIMSISIYPIAPIFSSYLCKNIFKIGDIRWPTRVIKNDNYLAKFVYFQRIYHSLREKFSNHDQKSKQTVVIEVLEYSKFDCKLFILENKEDLMTLFPISDVKVHILKQVQTPKIYIE